MASLFKIKGRTYWYVSYFFKGKRIAKSLRTTDSRLARKLRAEIEFKIRQGLHEELEIKSIDRYFQEYIKTISHRKRRTNDNELSTIRRFLRSIHETQINKITEEDIRAFLKDYESKAPETYNNAISTIKRFLKLAVERSYISKNPAVAIRKKRISQKEVTFFTDEECQKIEMATQNHPLFPMVVTAHYTGLRLQELIYLEWRDFDWVRRILHVRNKKDHTTKNYRNRTVPICEELKDKLLLFVKEEGTCFPVPGGKTKGMKYAEQGPRRAIKMIFQNAGVQVEKGKSWHKFRRTFATRLKDAGVSVAKISDWLGHSSLKVTELYLGCNSSYDEDIEKLTLGFDPGPVKEVTTLLMVKHRKQWFFSGQPHSQENVLSLDFSVISVKNMSWW